MQARRGLIGRGRIGAAILALAAVLGGALPAGAGDVVYRVVGVVPFPANARPGAAADTLDAQPKPSWVNDRYWGHLVFDLLDEPARDTSVIRTPGLMREQLAGLDIHITTAAPEAGTPPISDTMVSWWERALPDAVRRLTNQPWQGRLASGANSRPADVTGQVNIRVGTAAEFDDRPDSCAYASNGYYTFPDGSFAMWDSAEIVISPTARERCSIYDDPQSYTMVHELGHVLGLSHVDDPADLMYGNETVEAGYTQRLIDHSQLLYRTGPTVSYPGFADAAASRWTFYIEDFAYDAATRLWTGSLSHDGNEAGTPTQEFEVAMQFHDANGRRLDRDGEFVLAYDEELRVGWFVSFDFGPADDFLTPRNWETVTLLTSVRPAGRGTLSAINCIDGDDNGETRTAVVGGRQVSTCFYRRSDIAATPVPALPLVGVLLLAGLLGAIGLRRRRAATTP